MNARVATVTHKQDCVQSAPIALHFSGSLHNGKHVLVQLRNVVIVFKGPSPFETNDVHNLLNRYEEQFITGGKKRDFCTPKKSFKTQDKFDDKHELLMIVGIVASLLVSAILIFYLVWRKKKGVWFNNGNSRSSNAIEDTPPPPYEGHSSLLIPRFEVSDERVEILHIDNGKDSHLLQQAVPFRDPLPLSPRNNNEYSDNELSDDDDHNIYLPGSPLYIYEEETFPSTWTCEPITSQTANTSQNATPELSEAPACPNEYESAQVSRGSSSLTNVAPDDDPEDPALCHDSGLSASCSVRSSQVSLMERPFKQFAASSEVCHRSEEDISIGYQPANKKARRDSGSLSMVSVAADPLEDRDDQVVASGNPSNAP